MSTYLTTQQQTIFTSVGVLIYVFEVKSRDPQSDAEYFRRILDALRRFSPKADVFLLVHKMDLAGQGRDRQQTFERKRAELVKEAAIAAPGMPVQVFGTSIYDESLYKVSSCRPTCVGLALIDTIAIGLVSCREDTHT
jgi:Ras-related GTP-binding protein A/B